MLAITALVLASFCSKVYAHGHVKAISAGGVELAAYIPQTDGPATGASRDVHNGDNGPVSNFASNDDLRCGVKHSGKPAPQVLEVAQGGELTFTWDQWPSSHGGPVLGYVADCEGDCTTFIPDASTPFYKIEEHGMGEPGKFPASLSIASTLKHVTTIPSNLKVGEYLFRHELVALHSAPGDVQVYPSCHQIRVTGSGGILPSTSVQFPGAYSVSDPGFALNLYNPVPTTYTIPGGPIEFASSGDSADNAENSGETQDDDNTSTSSSQIQQGGSFTSSSETSITSSGSSKTENAEVITESTPTDITRLITSSISRSSLETQITINDGNTRLVYDLRTSSSSSTFQKLKTLRRIVTVLRLIPSIRAI